MDSCVAVLFQFHGGLCDRGYINPLQSFHSFIVFMTTRTGFYKEWKFHNMGFARWSRTKQFVTFPSPFRTRRTSRVRTAT